MFPTNVVGGEVVVVVVVVVTVGSEGGSDQTMITGSSSDGLPDSGLRAGAFEVGVIELIPFDAAEVVGPAVVELVAGAVVGELVVGVVDVVVVELVIDGCCVVG